MTCSIGLLLDERLFGRQPATVNHTSLGNAAGNCRVAWGRSDPVRTRKDWSRPDKVIHAAAPTVKTCDDWLAISLRGRVRSCWNADQRFFNGTGPSYFEHVRRVGWFGNRIAILTHSPEVRFNSFGHSVSRLFQPRPRGNAARQIRRVRAVPNGRWFVDHSVLVHLSVPGATSSDGWPLTVTLPGFVSERTAGGCPLCS